MAVCRWSTLPMAVNTTVKAQMITMMAVGVGQSAKTLATTRTVI